MRTTVIPAQITTVEDRIAGNFTFTQILLFLMPLFITVFVYGVLPVRLHFSLYKFVIIAFFSLLCLVLAVRIKGKIVLHWVGVLSAYYMRPRYYLFNKNNTAFRDVVFPVKEIIPQAALQENMHEVNSDQAPLSLENSVKLKKFVSDPQSVVRFRFKKGGINVVTSQVS